MTNDPQHPSPASFTGTVQSAGTTPLILLVEDDPELRQMLEMMLRLEMYEVATAGNGQQGLDLMRQRRPCTVLLDLMMPVMDGWEFRRQQLQDPALAAVPVLCITAVPNPAEVSARLGVQCLSKPLDSSRLLDEVQARCRAAG
jgi:CheY-like chemotaxis protein